MTVAKTKAKPKTRKGKKLYEANPFIGNAVVNTKQGVKKITDKGGTRMMVTDQETGEVTTRPAGFWHAQEVDKTQFVKLYVNGVKAFRELTGAGTKVFELLYLEVQKQIGKDKVYLSYQAIDQDVTPMSDSTYTRGMRELQVKGFIAPSVLVGWFFINPDYMWNGDRLAFVKEYRLRKPVAKGEPKPIADDDNKTMDMFEEQASE